MGKSIEMTGMRFGKLLVLERAARPRENGVHWKCLCDCGAITVVVGGHLRTGHTMSCGCHGKSVKRTHGESKSRLYRIWAGVRSRCCNPQDIHYADYGGRGIKVCAEWEDFEKFSEWAMSSGYNITAEQGRCTIDRIDNNGDYSPENCRWVDSKVQCRNKRNNHIIAFGGESHPLVEWAEIIGMHPNTLHARIVLRGWSIPKALTTPVMSKYNSRR